MRIVFVLLMIAFMANNGLSQQPVKDIKKPIPDKVPSKNQIQGQLGEAINEINIQIADLEKQLAEAIKNKEDEETIKDLRDQIAMLKQQVEMMGGLGKTVSTISEKTFQQAGEEGKNRHPKKDMERINAIPKMILSRAEIFSLVKKIHAGVEKLIPLAEKSEAIGIYTETSTKYKTVREINNAAAACWIYGNWEKALWLSGRASIEDVDDPDNLNNYAAYLTMIGAEHAAIPILQYLNQKYPKNSTILNNIGQAWYGLGDIASATGFLERATGLFPNHAMANLTLSRIYGTNGDATQAIAAMRRSIQSTYTPDKEAELEKLGGELDDDDIEFDYPMEDDPFGFEPFFDEFPPVPGSVGETPDAWGKWTGFKEATTLLSEKTAKEEAEANIYTKAFMEQMGDPDFHQPLLKMHNGNVYYKAGRKLPLALLKKNALSIGDVMNLMANKFHDVTTERLNALEQRRRTEAAESAGDCSAIDAVNNRFMSDAKAIIDEGRIAMRQVYLQHKKKVQKHIQLQAYAALNNYNERMGRFHEEIWQKNQWIYSYQAGFMRSYGVLAKQPPMFSSCTDTRHEYPTQPKQLPALKKPNCTYTDGIELCIGAIKETCNTCNVDESKIKVRQNDVQKGEVSVSDSLGTSSGPQKEESSGSSKIKNFSCDKTAYVKDNRRHTPSGQLRCTVNSVSAPNSVRMSGGRLAR